MEASSNIVFFTTSLDSGGLENYLLRFLEHKAPEFKRIIVFCKGGKGGQLQDRYHSIPNVEIHLKQISFFDPKDYIYIYKFFKKNQVDSACDFTGNFAALPLLVAKRARVKKRIAFYRGSTNHFKEDLFRLIYNAFLNKLVPKVATAILSNSKAALDFFFDAKWKKDMRFEVLYNGIDAEAFLSTADNLREELNIPAKAFVVGHVGRYNIAKNHKTMIKVAVKICKNNVDVYFVFCGDKVVEGLEQDVQRANLGEQIKLLGFRNDVIKVLNTLDCFYFPSLTEGQPNALIEAMVAGLPIIASDIAPIKETVPEAFWRELSSPHDMSGHTAKILELYHNNSIQKEYNLKNWAINTFDANVQFNKFLNYLKQ